MVKDGMTELSTPFQHTIPAIPHEESFYSEMFNKKGSKWEWGNLPKNDPCTNEETFKQPLTSLSRSA